MAQVIFYEKPGCINNTKQKAWLTAAGHEVVAKNILETKWTPEELALYFNTKPIAECFNRTAPSVKSGEIVPESFSTEDALELMTKEPLLIKRPLILAGDRRMQGFDKDAIHAWLGLDPSAGNEAIVQELCKDDLTICPRLKEETNCDDQVAAIPERPLSLIMEISQAVGLDVVHEYDDLVFVSHNIFIYQFTDTSHKVDLFFNQDCEEKAEKKLMEALLLAAGQKGIILTKRGHYKLSEAKGENISIEFLH